MRSMVEAAPALEHAPSPVLRAVPLPRRAGEDEFVVGQTSMAGPHRLACERRLTHTGRTSTTSGT